jgi:predicted GH43/DUF377 family glycosyl hydrolase
MVINLSWCAGDYDRKVYHAKAALMHLENLRWNYRDCLTPLFTNKKWEKKGVVNNVVFPLVCIV